MVLSPVSTYVVLVTQCHSVRKKVGPPLITKHCIKHTKLDIITQNISPTHLIYINFKLQTFHQTPLLMKIMRMFLKSLLVGIELCTCVCVCVRVCMYVCMCVCVCVCFECTDMNTTSSIF